MSLWKKFLFNSLVVLSTLFFAAALQPAQAAVPGMDLFQDGLGVSTWTWTDNSGVTTTSLLHSLLVIDYDGVSANGSSHFVTVKYPGASESIPIPFSSYRNSTSAYYELQDNNINQNNLSSCNGTYTYRVQKAGNSGSFSEATDTLTVAPVAKVNEASFAPKHSSPQSITAYFDNVYVNGALYDDFSAGIIDPNKWYLPVPGGVSYEGGMAKFAVDFNPGAGSYNLSVKNPPAGFNQVKATVKVANQAGDKPNARVSGTFCRNEVGDIYASVRILGNQATYTIGPEGFDGYHYWGKYYATNAPIGPVTPGNSYNLSVQYDQPTGSVTFKVVGLNDSVNYSFTHALSGTVEPIPIPSGAISVAAWVIVPDTQPEISWDPVAGATFYRVRIYALSNNNTLFRGYTSSTSYKLPPGILKPNSYYKYRIDAIRDHQWFEWDNGSRSDPNRTRFGTGPQEAQAPHVDLASIGAEVFNEAVLGPMVSFYIKVYDAQGVPQNIESVQAIVPGGAIVDLSFDVNEGPNCGLYRGNYFGGLPGGVYTFTASDKDHHTHSAADILTVSPLAPPTEMSLRPLDNVVIGGTGVTFDWDDVPGAAQYELQIYDKSLTRLFTLRSVESQVSIPPGILKENSYYRYRLLARKEFYEGVYSNGSSAPAGSVYDSNAFFTTGKNGNPANLPVFNIDRFGVAVWMGPFPGGGTLYNLEFSALVTDADGVPENIRSVEVTFPDGITKKTLKYDNKPDWGFNFFEDETYSSTASIQFGTYSFMVTDFEGNMAGPITDVLSGPLPAFSWPTILSPSDGESVDTTTPTVSWSVVPDAAFYRVRVMNGYGSTDAHYSPDIPLPQTSYTLPSGVLQPNRGYGIRIYAFMNPIGSECDVYSGSSTISQQNVHITVADTVTGNNIQLAPLDQNTGQANVTMTIETVTAPGTTTLATSPAGPEPPPAGFMLGDPPTVYDILTTATFEGNIEVCIDYGDTYYENESAMKLYHYDNLTWVDVTTTHNLDTDVICGNVTSLSPFAVVQPHYCKGNLDPDGDVDGADLALFARDYGKVPPNLNLDLNNDGKVDYLDLFKLGQNFGKNDCAVVQPQ